MRAEMDGTVVSWVDALPPESIWTTAITVFEIRLGFELMATGKRRRQLEEAFAKTLLEDLDGRVLSFDEAAADAAGRLAAEQRRAGRSLEIRDLQIAGIAVAKKASLATRNRRHFDGLGIRVLDPWSG